MDSGKGIEDHVDSLIGERKQSVPFYKLFFFDDPWQDGCLGGIRKLIHHGYYRHDRQDHGHIQITYEMGNRNHQDRSRKDKIAWMRITSRFNNNRKEAGTRVF